MLLEAAARQDAADARPWLMLASIAATPRERRAFMAQAERLKAAPAPLQPQRGRPAMAAVPATMTYPVPGPSARGGSSWVRAGLIVALALAIALGGFLLSQTSVGQALVQDMVAQVGGEAAPDEIVAAAADDTTPTAEAPDPTPTQSANPAQGTAAAPSPTRAPATAEPTGDAPWLPEKEAALGGEPLPTWTVTVEPTPTLAPTATPTATPEPSPTPVPPPPGSPRPLGVGPNEKWIDINLTTQTLTAYEGDTPVLSTLISSGRWEYQTVTGEFRTYLKYDLQTMSGYHLGLNYVTTDVPHVMYFYRDFAIHGAYWHSSFGTPVSHGCVNATPADAAWLYSWAPLGTLVSVHY